MSGTTSVVPEQIHPGLDAQLRLNFEPRVLAVYADWLEERGDPRAALIRVQLAARRDGVVTRGEYELDEYGEDRLVFVEAEEQVSGQLLQAHWQRWFGDLPWRAARFTWSGGFIREAEVQRAPESWTSCRPLLGLPSLRFLRALRVTQKKFSGTMEGLESGACLEEVSWRVEREGCIAPLRGLELSKLATLNLELVGALNADDALGMIGVRCPALRLVDVVTSETNELLVVDAIRRAPWVAGLRSLSLMLHSKAGIVTLAKGTSPVRALGAGLRISMAAALLAEQRDLLREQFPGARLSPLPTQRPPDLTFNGPTVSDLPVMAPLNYLELSPWELAESRSGTNSIDCDVHRGSGVPFAVASPQSFSWCFSCGSADTACIFLSLSSMYSHFETTYWKRCEYVCQECGKFTHYVETSVS